MQLQLKPCCCLQDHPACLAAFKTKAELGNISITDEMLAKNGNVRLRAIINYLLRRKGPLTSTGCDHGAFVSTKGALKTTSWLLLLCQTWLPSHAQVCRLQQNEAAWDSHSTSYRTTSKHIARTQVLLSCTSASRSMPQ